MDATLTLDEIDRHVSAIFDINVAATHCIRLHCDDCAGLSILPVPGPGVDEDRPWLREGGAPASGGGVVGVPRRAARRRRWRFYRTVVGSGIYLWQVQ